jgi:FKBP-type peptidyl-prolyl cis-trans isomerase 2
MLRALLFCSFWLVTSIDEMRDIISQPLYFSSPFSFIVGSGKILPGLEEGMMVSFREKS